MQRPWGLFKIGLAGLFLLIPCGSVILVYHQNGTSGQVPTRFDDVPAMKGFGPRIGDQGFAGRLQLAKPDIYGCSALDRPTKQQTAPTPTTDADNTDETPAAAAAAVASPSAAQKGTSGSPGATRKRGWHRLNNGVGGGVGMPIAVSRQPPHGEILAAVGEAGGGAEELPTAVLISRSVKDDRAACTFETKMLNAQAAGYSMVIVYDSMQGNMFKMGGSSGKGSQQPEVEIPSVLVTQASGLALTAVIDATANPSGPEVYVDNTDPFGMFVTVDLTMFMLVTGFLLALLTCGSMMVVTLHRYLRRYESLVAGTNRPMSLPEVLQLPEVRVEEGSRLEGDSCPVCLEGYRLGDKLRSLPCGHAFHAGCITPWLTQRQRTCPMCKDPVTLGASPTRSAPAAVAPSSSTPSAEEADFITPTSTGGDQHSGATGEGRGGGSSAADGDRLPLLSNSRGSPSAGGSIQDTSPV